MPPALEHYIQLRQPTTAVFDLDGTLLAADGTLTEPARQALRRLRAQDIGILIATGRSWAKVRPFWSELASTYPVICSCGRVIYDPDLDRVLYTQALDGSMALQVRKRTDGLAYVLTETPTHFWCPDVKAAFLARLALKVPRDSIRIGPPPPAETPIIGLYLVSCTAAPLPASLYNDLSMDIGTSAEVRQDDARWLSISTPPRKASALDWLCTRHQISLERVIAFGDGENDLELFQRVGFAIAPSNASAAVKQRAQLVTRQEYELGVYQVVSEWIALLSTSPVSSKEHSSIRRPDDRINL